MLKSVRRAGAVYDRIVGSLFLLAFPFVFEFVVFFFSFVRSFVLVLFHLFFGSFSSLFFFLLFFSLFSVHIAFEILWKLCPLWMPRMGMEKRGRKSNAFALNTEYSSVLFSWAACEFWNSMQFKKSVSFLYVVLSVRFSIFFPDRMSMRYTMRTTSMYMGRRFKQLKRKIKKENEAHIEKKVFQ